MLHFILDGYNIINILPPLKASSLQSSRERLFAIVQKYNFQGSRRNRLTVVFDGKEGVIGQRYSFDFSVVFSRNEKADDVIERMVADSKYPKQFVLISNDRDLQRKVRLYGAAVRTVEDFFTRVTKRPSRSTVPDKLRLSTYQMDAITQELEDLWLDQNEKEKEQ